jgi:uncharacterized protein (TIGR02594 family)
MSVINRAHNMVSFINNGGSDMGRGGFYPTRRSFVLSIAALVSAPSLAFGASAEFPFSEEYSFAREQIEKHNLGDKKPSDASMRIAEEILENLRTTNPYETMKSLMNCKMKSAEGLFYSQRWPKDYNPVIETMFENIGYHQDSKNDCDAWCAAAVSYCLFRCNRKFPRNAPATALAYLHWGDEVNNPTQGDICVFRTKGGGHVGFYVESLGGNEFSVMGGNQDQSNPDSTRCGQRKPVPLSRITIEPYSMKKGGYPELVGFRRG